jgi:hypothetical protein
MHIRNQQSSDGTLRTWKWPASLGPNYVGPKVTMTVEHVELTEERRVQLQRVERRTKVADLKIQRNTHGNQRERSVGTLVKGRRGKTPSVMKKAFSDAAKKKLKRDE